MRVIDEAHYACGGSGNALMVGFIAGVLNVAVFAQQAITEQRNQGQPG
jgi:hypothetical protein